MWSAIRFCLVEHMKSNQHNKVITKASAPMQNRVKRRVETHQKRIYLFHHFSCNANYLCRHSPKAFMVLHFFLYLHTTFRRRDASKDGVRHTFQLTIFISAFFRFEIPISDHYLSCKWTGSWNDPKIRNFLLRFHFLFFLLLFLFASLELILYVTIFGFYFSNSILRKKFFSIPLRRNNYFMSPSDVDCYAWKRHRWQVFGECIEFDRLENAFTTDWHLCSVIASVFWVCRLNAIEFQKHSGGVRVREFSGIVFFLVWFLFLLLHMI